MGDAVFFIVDGEWDEALLFDTTGVEILRVGRGAASC